MTEQAPELLPCPFCGGEAMIFRKTEACCKNEKCAGWTVNHCGFDKWNRRADAPPTLAEAMTVPEVRALVEALTVAIEVAEDEGLDGLAKEWRAVIAAIRAREGGKP
jgi:hypothetical protein